MAKHLRLDRAYYNQLEAGKKPVQAWQIEEAEKLERVNRGVDKSTVLNEGMNAPPSPVRMQCEEHMTTFLNGCEEDLTRLGWTLHELRSRFPLDKWEKEISSRSDQQAMAEAGEKIAHALDELKEGGSGGGFHERGVPGSKRHSSAGKG